MMKYFMRDTKGSNAVEFSIILPAFITIIVIILEFGQLLWIMNTLNYAVEDAARCGAVNTKSCGTVDQIQTLASARSMGLAAAGDFTVTRDPSGATCVSTQYTFQPVRSIRFSFRSCDA